MRAAAEVTALFPERSADPLEHVDYRLAETPEEKDEIYRLRYRAYLREGAILPSESERVTDRYDDELMREVYASRVSADLVSGMRSGVTATPTFFINGARQAGTIRFETLLVAVQAAAQR